MRTTSPMDRMSGNHRGAGKTSLEVRTRLEEVRQVHILKDKQGLARWHMGNSGAF
jgi:hypothetical protein